jgi:hypothetical protein
MRFSSFGTAVYGRESVAGAVNDCPVPEGAIVKGFIFTPEEHDSWCNCVYGAVPGLNELCKIKVGQKLPNGAAFLDPSMPWTFSGKRTRGLTNDALGQLLQAAMAATGKAIEAGIASVTGTEIDDGHLAVPAGTPSLTGGSPNTGYTAEKLNLLREEMMRQGAASRRVNPSTGTSAMQEELDRLRRLAAEAYNAQTTMPTGLLVVGGLVALYFATRKKKATLSVAGFGAYGGSRRKRVRRSRR